MKRILAGLATACAATLVAVTPTAAQAAPVDPVKALKQQYAPGHGVRFVESAHTSVGGKTMSAEKATGRLAFGKNGVVASDISTHGRRGTSLSPDRMISVGGHAYFQGGVYEEGLPEGKKWVRYEQPAGGTTLNQPLDIFEPKILKALVSKARSVKGGTYKGEITYKEIAKLYGETLKGAVSKIKVTYALGLNSKGLVNRLRTSWTLDFGVLGKTTGTTDTRYIGWGSRVTIKAPAQDTWVDAKSLGEDSDVPEQVPQDNLHVFAH
ncbi:hypothetical protein MF672_047555 [Actinomadura sp. ATCC 31491]|uniref:Lipoprotein n=1 Tax=Actinomadura luzonensis TaxID=2805427 RepID=A0ABT0G9Z4_9ACTN|nr:hypothetical protein [Actinomadura luzonensis]MCK2221412.1 hypothetical protein [Actinomadura luzonensis]